ncbi:hypothetical protein PR003_g32151 [Phytophthora rubi]|uniref:RxLR effector protein n=1 Tax=Phytophthora rubi TaxID=129364 RepID=A0A6A3HB34_9STRA|nr:hypothetical protein PR002_g28282 [Phytophthora rubi]KAE8967471.1 hypothetical protein PR001_g28087 [Phytophthora rubi]KAE9266359.1 hypothetical protein PR003_g32151 [Phytophthora rubi]
MRLSTTLLVVVAAGLFAVGHAADQTKISQSQDVAPFEHATGGKGLLRAVAIVNEDDEEERGLTTPLLARLPGTTQNTARNAEKAVRKAEEEAMKIRWFRVDFEIWMKMTKGD